MPTQAWVDGEILIEAQASAGVHTFIVTDDGSGFVKPTRTSGMGLNLMKYRARMIGAEIAHQKPVKGGCRVTCRLTS